jgi:hypothetical protein
MTAKRTIYDAHIQVIYEPGKEPEIICKAAQIGPNHVLSQLTVNEAMRRYRLEVDKFTRPVPKWPFEGGSPGGGAMPVPQKQVVAA